MRRWNVWGDETINNEVPGNDSVSLAGILAKLEPTPDAIPLVCRSFDPDGMMNPGKLFSD
jgi:hypothetical protein